MKGIQVQFEHLGKRYTGDLQPVTGSGGGVYHLVVEHYYWGRLRHANGDWVLDVNKRSAGVEILAGIAIFLVTELLWANR